MTTLHSAHTYKTVTWKLEISQINTFAKCKNKKDWNALFNWKHHETLYPSTHICNSAAIQCIVNLMFTWSGYNLINTQPVWLFGCTIHKIHWKDSNLCEVPWQRHLQAPSQAKHHLSCSAAYDSEKSSTQSIHPVQFGVCYVCYVSLRRHL